jgi:hypothetical protein
MVPLRAGPFHFEAHSLSLREIQFSGFGARAPGAPHGSPRIVMAIVARLGCLCSTPAQRGFSAILPMKQSASPLTF